MSFSIDYEQSKVPKSHDNNLSILDKKRNISLSNLPDSCIFI